MWQEKNQKLTQKFVFKDFKEALNFINEVGTLSEKANHHPIIENTYNTVILTLSTHDEGNVVTQKDRDLAETIDQLLQQDSKLADESFDVSEHDGRLKLYCDGGSRGNPGPSASGYFSPNFSD